MTLSELRAASPPGTDVVKLLDAAKIPHGGGLVPRAPVERLLGLRPDVRVEVPAVDLLRALLRPAQIELRDAKLTRGWRILIAATKPRQIFHPLLHAEDPVRWPAVDLPAGQPIEAKLHLATARRASAAHFLVSGLDTFPDDQLFVFVLVAEPRLWIATRRELLLIEQAQGKNQIDFKKRFGRVGALRRNAVRRALRLWFPVSATSWDVEQQVRDAHGARVLKTIERGGRPR